MVQGTVRHFFRIVGALGLALSVGVSLLAWRVATAPLPLDFLTPYIEEALTPGNGSYRFTLGGTALHWARERETLDIQATGVTVKAASGETVVLLPAVSVSFSVQALLQGRIAPHAIEVLDSRLHLRRTKEGFVFLNTDTAATGRTGTLSHAMGRLIAEMLPPPDPTRPRSSLRRIRLTGGAVTLDDAGTLWTANAITLELTQDPDGIRMTGRLQMQTADGPVPVAFNGHQNLSEDRNTHLVVTFSGLRPASLAHVPGGQALAGVDLPVAGTVSVRLMPDGAVDHLGFSLESPAGTVTLPAPQATAYEIRSLRVHGTVEPGFHGLTLDHGRIELADGPWLELAAATLTWTPPPAPEGPVLEGEDSAKDTMAGHSRANDSMKTPATPKKNKRRRPPLPPVPPPWLAPSPAVPPSMPAVPAVPPSGRLTLAADFTVSTLLLNDLMGHWPVGVASDPRAWIGANLRDGRIEQARFTASLGGPDAAGLAVESFYGALTVHEATIDYLKPMPPVRHATADVIFHPDRLEITARGGGVHDLRVTEGTVVITGLDHVDQFCAIALTVTGPVRDALRVIDSEPLGYATALGLAPAQADGSAVTRLVLTFPVEKSLTIDQIVVKAHARLSDLALRRLVAGHDMTNGTFTLAIDTEKLQASGQAVLADVPVQMEWHEFFDKTLSPVRSRYGLEGTFGDESRVALGLDFPPFVPSYLSGPVHTKLTASVGFDGTGTVNAEADLTAATLALAGIGWRKAAGQPATATGVLHAAAGVVRTVSRFALHAEPEAFITGHIAFTPAGRLEEVAFDRLRIGRTDLTGTLNVGREGDWRLNMTGPAVDLVPFLQSPASSDDAASPDLTLALTATRLWGSEAGSLSDVTVMAHRENNLWHRGTLKARVGTDETVTATLAPGAGLADESSESSLRTVTLDSDDAGALLRTFDLFDNMIGGRVQVRAILDESNILQGSAEVQEYRLVNAPLLARLLTVAALTGILESLTGDGLRFTNLEMPFVHHDGVLSVTDFRTSGPSLGLTAMGKLFLREERMEMNGTIVPIYLLNSLLGKIPVLGDLITGEKGGGLFAATYTMTGSLADPVTTLNPLAVVAPGFLRNLFKVFDSVPDKKDDIRQNPGQDKK